VFFSQTFFAGISQAVPIGKCKMQRLHFKRKKELPENKGNPLASTLGTTILVTLCNFLIAEDK